MIILLGRNDGPKRRRPNPNQAQNWDPKDQPGGLWDTFRVQEPNTLRERLNNLWQGPRASDGSFPAAPF
jgi:hypothetical protein